MRSTPFDQLEEWIVKVSVIIIQFQFQHYFHPFIHSFPTWSTGVINVAGKFSSLMPLKRENRDEIATFRDSFTWIIKTGSFETAYGGRWGIVLCKRVKRVWKCFKIYESSFEKASFCSFFNINIVMLNILL